MIQLTYTTGWSGIEYLDHLAVECLDPPKTPLPITETGYRSAFFDDDTRPGGDSVGYTERWLNEAAQDKTWRAHVETTRQFRLF